MSHSPKETTALRAENAELRARMVELESQAAQMRKQLKELEAYNLELERETARRGVKLNCANIALSRAKIVFDQQARHKEEAVQDIAHDLRTPLTSIKGAAQNVLDGIAGPVDEGVREYVTLIANQSVRLIGVVNWLLQAIRITSQPRTLDAKRQDLTQLLAEVIEGLAPIALEKRIQLTLRGPVLLGCLDAPKLHQVMDNLIGNAIKFTESGGRVTVTTEGDEGTARVHIEDTGIGMEGEAMQSLLDRFFG